MNHATPSRSPLTTAARAGRQLAFVALGLLLAAPSFAGALFTVTLTNGTSFETRYRPVEAEWDDSVVMIRTDRGNWIAVAKSDITDVVSRAEVTGFGYQLNTTTLFVGWSPNDLIDDSADEDGEDGGGGGGGGDNARPYYENDDLYDAPASDGGFTLEQFVDVPSEGESIGAIDTGPAATRSGDDG